MGIDVFPDESSLLEAFRTYLPVLEPRYTNIRPGDLGVTVGESVIHAFVLAADVVNEFPARAFYQTLRNLGKTPNPADAATCPVTFTINVQGSNHTIPAGSLWGTDTGLQFELQANVTITAGQTTHSTPGLLKCLTTGEEGNIAAGQAFVNLSNIAHVTAATNAEAATGGESAETQEEFIIRATAEFAQHGMLLRVEDWEKAAAEVPGVLRAKCLPSTSLSGATFISPSPGAVTVIALSNDGAPLTLTLKNLIKDALEAQAFLDLVANDSIYVTDFAQKVLTVQYVAVAKAGQVPANVQTIIEAEIARVLSAPNWIPGREVSPFEVGGHLEALPEVDRVREVRINGSYVPVALSAYEVPSVSTITGSVT